MPIAFDSVSKTTSSSWSHTCATDSVLFVCTNESGFGSPTATYNGVSMTQLAATGNYKSTGSARLVVWYLLNPASGTNTVALSSGTFDASMAISYTGADLTAQPDVYTSGTSGGSAVSTFNQNITTTRANDWLLWFLGTENPFTSPSFTNTSERDAQGNSTPGIRLITTDSNGTVTVGNVGDTASQSTRYAGVMIGVQEPASDKGNFFLIFN